MEYLINFNQVVNIIESEGVCKLSDAQIDLVRVAMKQCYNSGFKDASKANNEGVKESYEEGRQIGHSLGYKEGFDAGRVIRQKRLLNAYGGR